MHPSTRTLSSQNGKKIAEHTKSPHSASKSEKLPAKLLTSFLASLPSVLSFRQT